MSRRAATIAALCLAALAVGTLAPRVGADTPAESGPAPTAVEQADDLVWKATGSLYLQAGNASGDVNLRRQAGPFAAWLGVFSDPGLDSVARAGVEWDLRRGALLFVPALQAATNGLQAGQLYAELGGSTYVIAGFSRTNLKPFYNLSWDPNESAQLGLGHRFSRYDRLFGFTIFDVRLHSGQQDTHVLWRHELSPGIGLTLDGLYKSGHLDSGRFVRSAGIGAYLDGSRWLLKAYYDPYASFSEHAMFRVGLGAKF